MDPVNFTPFRCAADVDPMWTIGGSAQRITSPGHLAGYAAGFDPVWHSGAMTTTATDDAHVDFDCPRCSRTASQTYWGPCEQCRTELRATLGGEARTVEAAAYEPKMNVTPNAVATKD